MSKGGGFVHSSITLPNFLRCIVLYNNIEEQTELVVDQQEQEDEDDFSFLGYVYPTPSEKLGNASRTELYQCRTCLSYTRFPRYNKALWVTTTQRGRCGEYSMLL